MSQLDLEMEASDCPHFDECEAPLCPLDVNLEQHIWFPKDPVCRRRSVPDWVGKQKRIRRLKKVDPDCYFTVRMLNALIEVPKDVAGISTDDPVAEITWLRHHRVKQRKKRPRKSPQLGFDI